ncbi:hypothetical protein Aasi_1280 [Candidatus Amoebophilus asiaticus 5a2]|uniref:Uncharacterized protein n=1 Tax=Amoebophilus asiaticus (strain 5a2) TaxID=452471 RepID=B3ETP5_AMOA5|nr:hypothetical protein [Candidatus Amoebophilus asiaticus]ACE06597.1 hypothetical protein Aasi_1280 [Candidatus Amoebophilus asiaticus 5a2]
MKQFNYINRHITAYFILLSFYFLQSCVTDINQVATTKGEINISIQCPHDEKTHSAQEVIIGDTQHKEVTQESKEAINILSEHQGQKEGYLVSNDKHVDKVLVQHAPTNTLILTTRQRSLKSKTLHSALLQERNRLITNNISNLIISKAPHGQILISSIKRALKTNRKDTLLFEGLDFQEQDFVQLSYHPFFKEKCKRIIYCESVNPMQKSTLHALGKSLQGTQIEEVHVVSNRIGSSMDSSAIIDFLKELRGTKVRVLNLRDNGLLFNMVDVSDALIGTQVYTIDLSNNYIHIPMESANLVGRNLYRTQIRYIDLMANPIESEVQQFLKQNFNRINWKFLQLIFLEIF